MFVYSLFTASADVEMRGKDKFDHISSAAGFKHLVVLTVITVMAQVVSVT